MQFTPYLSFDRQCEAAFRFYHQVLGGEIVHMQTHGDSAYADQTPPEWRDTIIHARLVVGDAVLMGSDMPPGAQTGPKGMCVNIGVADPAEADRIFAALADGGSVQMPIGETFWAKRFGMCTDRFGTPWMINCESA